MADASAPGAEGSPGEVASAIAAAFDAYRSGFASITRRARDRFRRQDWHGEVADSVLRLDLYGHAVNSIERRVRSSLADRTTDETLWTAARGEYSTLVAHRDDRELAETFFNSVTRRIFTTVGVDQQIEFVDTDFDAPPPTSVVGVTRIYRDATTAGLVEAILRDPWFDAPYRDLRGDAALAAGRLEQWMAEDVGAEGIETAEAGAPVGPFEEAELVRSPFFRRKGAYLVGALRGRGVELPFALAFLNTPEGVLVDAVLTGQKDLSVLFSFTRSHFHVDTGPPAELVAFLKRLMPEKRVAELYISIGFHKHGKTELYRDLLRHLETTPERFELAPGTPGLVMIVFTMPGFDMVVKVIRDRFPPPKSVTRDSVMRSYRLVFRHDRAGRLVEAQEFEHLEFDRHRFSDEALEELAGQASRTVEIGDDWVVLHHAYVERRVDPLDVYVRTESEEAARAAVVDMGQAVEDLAATDVFTGDLLPKNFGVTRHGRVVCYDYDELSLLTDLSFREMPSSDSYDDEFGDEPWFGVTPLDVFPEEFPTFIALPPDLKELLGATHGNLYDLTFWQEIQQRVRSGEIVDIYPYSADRRLQQQ
jgi:isocitrate dehydrogenase kinase/phosphatase